MEGKFGRNRPDVMFAALFGLAPEMSPTPLPTLIIANTLGTAVTRNELFAVGVTEAASSYLLPVQRGVVIWWVRHDLSSMA